MLPLCIFLLPNFKDYYHKDNFRIHFTKLWIGPWIVWLWAQDFAKSNKNQTIVCLGKFFSFYIYLFFVFCFTSRSNACVRLFYCLFFCLFVCLFVCYILFVFIFPYYWLSHLVFPCLFTFSLLLTFMVMDCFPYFFYPYSNVCLSAIFVLPFYFFPSTKMF